MGMPAPDAVWTIDMLDALPESSERYEIIDGELFVTPAPNENHQTAAAELLTRLVLYLRGSNATKALFAPSDVWRGERRTNRVQPDVFVVRRGVPYPFHMRDLVLVVEVVSPGSVVRDYHVKRDLYLREGVPEYWVIDVDARNVSRWRGRDDPGDVLSRQIEWRMDGAVEPFVLDLPEFFAEVVR
jgi:Uma2 family endonuclease